MNAIAERAPEATAPTVTADQMDLIRRTVANGATADELKLYLFDCARQGVHPLDRLIHFTKRSGKYTPITSIDFMRIRAADSGEYAGSDVPLFMEDGVWSSAPKTQNAPAAAMVTVWRLVQGTRCKFEAVARWSEYKPDANDFMWKKMPHTMLAKCAEALALRKGFPRQLAGLYAKEEMDQADSAKPAYVVEAPRERVAELVDAAPVQRGPAQQVDPSVGVHAGSSPASPTTDDGPDLAVDLPAGARLITKVEAGVASAKARITFNAPFGYAESKSDFLVFKQQLADLAAELCQLREPCFPELKKSASGNWRVENIARVPKDYDPPTGKPATGTIDASEIPF